MGRHPASQHQRNSDTQQSLDAARHQIERARAAIARSHTLLEGTAALHADVQARRSRNTRTGLTPRPGIPYPLPDEPSNRP
jgi:hypothetical protein